MRYLQHNVMAARVWIQTYCVKDEDGEPIMASFQRHDGAPFDVRYAKKLEPTSVDEEGNIVDNPVVRIFFNAEELADAGLARDPDNRDRIVIDGQRFVPAIVRTSGNAMIECQVQQTR